MESIFVNPVGFDLYIPTVKLGLLYYDRIYMLPIADLYGFKLPDAPRALERLINDNSDQMVALSQKVMVELINEYGPIDLFLRGPEEVGEIIQARVLRKIKNRLDFGGALEDFRRGMPSDEELNRIDGELEIAVSEGYIVYPKKELIESNLVDNMLKEIFPSFQSDISNAFGCLVANKEKIVLPESEKTRLKMWGVLAAAFASALKHPIMTTSPQFMYHLTNNINLIAQTEELEPFLAEKRWKAQQLSFLLCQDELPDTSNLSMDDVLEVRRQTEDILGEYRRNIKKFSATIAASPWDSGFSDMAKSIIVDDITPLIKEAKKKFFTHPPLFKIIAKSAAVGAAPIGGVQLVVSLFDVKEPIIIAIASLAAMVKGFHDFFKELSRQYTPRDGINKDYNGMLFLVKAKSILEARSC